MSKTVNHVLRETQGLHVWPQGWREYFHSATSCAKLAGYLALFVSVLVADTLCNFVFGHDKGSFDRFDELQ